MSGRLPVVSLRHGEGRRVRAGAPWVFSNEIVMDAAAKELSPGSVVHLAAEDGSLLGTGHFNPHSLIAVRLVARADEPLDEAFFVGALRSALHKRERLFAQPFYRLVHAEGDRLPGLVVDRFGDGAVVQITTAGMEAALDHIIAALENLIAPRTLVLRNDAPARALERLESYVRLAKGEVDKPLEVNENGVRYLANPIGGQKSGWYYDQRDNRAFAARLATGRTMLDAYCYSGGFAILAAAQGACVTAVDSSEPALELAKTGAALNGVDHLCRFVRADAVPHLEKLAQEGERFDTVVCDPPPFVKSRKDLEAGARAYRKLARLAAAVVAPQGFLMLASCSHNMPADRFMAECAAAIARAGRQAALIAHTGASPDHPVHPMLPESAYLKVLTYALD